MDFVANSTKELQGCVDSLANKVSPRGQGRTTLECEQYYIQRLLHLLLENDRLEVPFELRKRESPDFEIESGGTTVGVETMEAVNPSYAHAVALCNNLDHDPILDESFFEWGVSRDRGEIEALLTQTRLTGLPWVGDSVERQFAQSVVDCVEVKHRKLVGEYCRYEQDYLLIYHNNPTPCIEFAKAMAKAEHHLRAYWTGKGFDAVFVLKYDRPTRLIIFSKEYPTETLVEGEGTSMRGKRQFWFGSRGAGSGPGQPAGGQGAGVSQA